MDFQTETLESGEPGRHRYKPDGGRAQLGMVERADREKHCISKDSPHPK